MLNFGKAEKLCLFCLMRQNKIHGFTLADQEWIGPMIIKNFADHDWIGFNFLRIRIGLGLRNFTVRSSVRHMKCSCICII